MGAGKVRVIGRWWNGHWRAARRDIWLIEDLGVWLVIGRERGEMDGQVEVMFTDEARARRYVDRLIAAAPTAKGWRNLIGITDALPF